MKEYIIEKNNHACNWSWWYKIIYIWFFKKEFNFRFTLPEEAYYTKEEIAGKDGVSKVVGWAFPIHAEKPFGKWWITKWLVNSIIVGYKSNYDVNNGFKLYAINDNKGIETRPFLFNILAGDIIQGKVKKAKGGVKLYIDYINNIYVARVYVYPMNLSWFGYRISPYFGGVSKAIRTFKVFLDT